METGQPLGMHERNQDTDKSWYRFVDCEKWRATFNGGLDNLVPNFDYQEKPQVFAYYPQYYHKTDKDGRPLYIEQLGKINLDAMRKITTDERMLSNLVVEYEKMSDPRLPACSRKSGHLLETSCSIMDITASASAWRPLSASQRGDSGMERRTKSTTIESKPTIA